MRFVSLAMLLIAVTLSLIFYPALPDPMPTHWNASGEVDGWSPKLLGAFLMPMIMAGMAGLFLILPRISPRGYSVDEASRGYRAIELSIVAFLLCVHVVVLLMSTGTRIASVIHLVAYFDITGYDKACILYTSQIPPYGSTAHKPS